MIAWMETRAALIGAMARRLKVDVADACAAGHADQYAAMARRCLGCGSTTTCRAWLSDGGESDAYRGFCPNAAQFDRLGGLG